METKPMEDGMEKRKLGIEGADIRVGGSLEW